MFRSDGSQSAELLARPEADDAARWAAAMKQAVEENRVNDNTAAHEAVVGAWTSYRRSREIPTCWTALSKTTNKRRLEAANRKK
jgi:hypothetical protein